MKSGFGTLILILFIGLFIACNTVDSTDEDDLDPKPVIKTNSMQLYMHYMPWFQSKEGSGYWGSHWRMDNSNPDNIDENGKRDIAAHYYPLIGPYDSRDQDVIDYHLLLMKYAGVDAVLIDWYGTHNVHDYRPNLMNSNAFIDRVDDVGLKYAIVYEEYTAESVESQTGKTAIEAAREDIAYMESEYFIADEYLRINDQPLLMTFGPRYFRQENQWNQIFEGMNEEPVFLPLWSHSGRVGNHSDGEFSWVDFNSSLSELDNFYNRQAYLDVLIGSAYPRFHDYYEEGGEGDSYGRVYSRNGETLTNTLEKARQHELQYLQLVTWNDFGEGTVIEPTVEDEFLFLEIIQNFTGVEYGRPELELIHQYYLKRKEFAGNAEKEAIMEQVFGNLNALNIEQAKELLDGL
ncbi:MAG: glycoside hydrolase family 71/99-like protein [Balneolaceae bacterium]